jgi:hypothetical protein
MLFTPFVKKEKKKVGEKKRTHRIAREYERRKTTRNEKTRVQRIIREGAESR